MDEIRCPMCGKPNPADRDECQYCGARLKPLIAQPGEPEAGAPFSPGDFEGAPEEAADLPPMPEGAVPDWLQALRPEGEEAGPAGEDEGEAMLEDTELPDWLGEGALDDEAPPLPGSGAASEGGLPDWPFLSPRPDEAGQEPEQPEATDEGELPDWLSGAQPEGEEAGEAPEASSEGELPDWLSGAQPEGEEAGEAPDASNGGGLPDWPFLSPRPDDTGQEPEQPEAVDEGELPDWLSGAQHEGEEAGEALEPSSEGGLPDWPFLSPRPDEAAASQEPEQPEAIDEGELPDWLSATQPEGEEAGEAAEQPEALDESELPDWLSAAEPQEEAAGEESALHAEPFLPESQDEEAAPTAAFSSTEEPAAGEEEQAFDLPEAPGAAAYPFAPEESDLDWLQAEEAPQAGEEGAPEHVAPFEAGFEGEAELLEEGELPGWLTGAAEEEQPEGEASQEQVSEPEPAAAESLDEARVPGWLAELRPVDTSTLPEPAPEAPESEVTSGPLSGLKGILPAEPDVARAKRAPVYSVRLQVAESQAANAQLFTSLIENEGAARPRPTKAAQTSSRVARLLIFLVLLGAVLWPVLTGSQNTALPQIPAEIAATGNLIEALPPGAPVLLAVDFEPGFSGELEAASSAVVDHLMRQGAYLALVSTTATGPLQAERLVSNLNLSGGHAYAGIDQYANLGYIPGGPGGLRSFAEAPRRTLPFALSEEGAAADRVWTSGPLQEVEQLSDFALALVLTENPDTARTWIEQVQPMLGSAPLVMVSSAQADPLIRPYFAGQPAQVEGLVSGLAGGAAYESYTGRDGTARLAWDAYAFGLPVAAGLIILGALLAWISSSMSSRRRRRRQARSR